MSAPLHTRAALLVLPGLLMLGGCAVGPNYRRPTAVAAPVFSESQHWTPASPRQVPNQRWWTVYKDPTLDRLEQQVAVSNQTLKQAVAAYFASREVISVDRGTLLPGFTGTAGETRSGGSFSGSGGFSGVSPKTLGVSSTRTSFTTGISGNWQLDVWGRIRRTVESAVALAQASASDVAAARLSAQATLAQDYFDLRASEQELRLLQTSVKDYKTSLQIARNRVAAGVTTLSDVYSAQTLLENTQAQEFSVSLTRAKLVHAIAVLIGKPPSELHLAQGTFAMAVPVVPAGLPSQLLERRPDISVAERDVASANARIGIAESAWFPSVTLSGSYSFATSTFSTLLKASNALWSVGPSLAETLFNGGARLAQVREAKYNYLAAVASYRQTVLTAFQQVEDDLATLHYLQQQYSEQQAAVSDAQRSEQLILNQYKAGVSDFSSVITAQTTTLSSQITELSVQAQRLVASVGLISAVGGGWSSAQLRQPDSGVPHLRD